MIIVTKKINKVSVCVVAYNQQDYIGECLQSLLSQKTNFNFQIIVGDDCSTDSTAQIIADFANRYPETITPIFHLKNVGPVNNYLSVHAEANGEYIAHMDGDDYALPGKLMTLAKALDDNPCANVAWHRMYVLDGKSGIIVKDLIDVRLQPTTGFRRSDLLACGTVGFHSAKMYRATQRSLIPSDCSWMMDFYLSVKHLEEGSGIWVDELLGVYRANVGLMSDGMKLKIAFVKNLKILLQEYPDAKKYINSLLLVISLSDIKNRRDSGAIRLWFESFHVLSFYEVLRRYQLHRILRLPKF